MSEYNQTLVGTLTCGSDNCTTPLKLSYDGTYYASFGVSNVGSLSFTLPSGVATTFFSPMFIESTTTPQMTLRYDVSNYSILSVSSAGDLTMQATGTYIDFSSSNRVRVLNTTAPIGTASGCLILTGGMGIAGNIYAKNLIVSNLAYPQLFITNGSSSVYNRFGTDYNGNLIISTSGTQTIHTAKLYVDSPSPAYRVFGRIGTTYNAFWSGPWGATNPQTTIKLEKWGYMVFMSIAEAYYGPSTANSTITFVSSDFYIPTAYRPFSNTRMLALAYTGATVSTMVSCLVYTTGNIVWYAGVGDTNFSVGSTPGIAPQTLSWLSSTSL